REEQYAAGLEEVLDARERVVRIGMAREDVKQSDGVEARPGVDEIADRGAVDLDAAGARRACDRLRVIDADVLELVRRREAEGAVTHADLENAGARSELLPQRCETA